MKKNIFVIINSVRNLGGLIVKKKIRRKVGGCLAVAISASMAIGNIAGSLSVSADDFSFIDEDGYYGKYDNDKSDKEEEEVTQDAKIATSSNAARKTSFEEFGSDEFWIWYVSASEDDIKEWFESIRKLEVATSSEARPNYPECDLNDEDKMNLFEAWFMENCYVEDEDGFILDYDKLEEYISYSSFESAKAVLAWLSSVFEVQTLSSIGSLFPDNYGANADFLTHGRGTKTNPYQIDSVEDLRGLAVYTMSNDTTDQYFELTSRTYDLNGVWIPIGFVGNAGGNYVPFKGHIAAENGAVITNLGFGYGTASVTSQQAAAIRDQENVGFFGALDGATIEGITIQTNRNTVEGTENVGILAGYAVDSTIKNCTVRGAVKGDSNVGGIVGFIESARAASDTRDSVIEDCNATEVAVYISEKQSDLGAVGGIAGYAKNTIIADTTVKTNTGSGNHIYGNNAYVGGIVGLLEDADIYNAHLQSGEIGSSDSYAAGGIVGGYAGGQIKVARFGGETITPASTNNYHAAFIGTRVNNAGFTYGENGNIAYLFTDSKTKADSGICGSKIQDDNNYGRDAHIGYWHSDNTKYTLVTGSNTNPSDDYFYEELEKGILNIKKNGHFTQEGSDKKVIINHYTADSNGHPTRGYMLTVIDPTVNGKTAAEITASIKESYKPTVTSESLGAYAAGDKIYISFDNKSYGDTQYKLDPEKTPNPYYAYHEYEIFDQYEDDDNDAGNVERYQLPENGGYWLTMPDADTIVSAEYKAVAKSINLNPAKIKLYITQTRSGNRDSATVVWTATAKDENNNVIVDGNNKRWENVVLSTNDSNPEFYIASLINNQVNDEFNLMWSTGNTDDHGIITDMKSTSGLAADKNAKFKINVTDSAMNDYTNKAREEQLANGNKNSMSTVSPIYYHTLVTAVANTNDSAYANDPPKGYTDMDIYFNIVDNTNTSITGVGLNKNTVTYNIVRTLSGDRSNPTVEYTVEGQAPSDDNTLSSIQATFNPDYFTNQSVKWYLTNTGTEKDEAVTNDEDKTDDGTINISLDNINHLNDYHYGIITLKGIEKTRVTNTFVAGHANDQDSRYTSQMKKVPDTLYSYEKDVKVTAHDENNNVKTDTCRVNVTFKTVDNTTIHPTSVKIDQVADISYDLSYTMEGDIHSDIIKRDGFGSQTLTATVQPGYDNTDEMFQPYDKEVVWSSSDPDVVYVDSATGEITVMGYDAEHPSKWINDIMADPNGGYVGEKTVTISARTNDQANKCVDTKEINVKFHVESISVNTESMTFDTVLTQDVMKNVDDVAVENSHWSGIESQLFEAKVTSSTQSNPLYTVIEGADYVTVDTKGNVNVKTDAQWIQDIINGRAEGNTGAVSAKIMAKTADGTPLKVCTVNVKFRYDATELNKNETILNVVAVQGNNTIDANGTREWTFDSDILNSTVYSANGISSDAKYTISDNDLLEIDASGKITPKMANWMLDIVDSGSVGGNHNGSKIVYVTSTSPDGATKDVCKVTINFRYDNTVLNKTAETFDVVLTNNSRTNSPKVTWTGLDAKQLTAKVYADSGVAVVPTWESMNTEVLTVDKDGRIAPIKDAKWMRDLIAEGKHSGTQKVIVNAVSADGKTTDSCTVTVNFRYDDVELSKNTESFDLVLTQTRRTNDPAAVWSGNVTKKIDASVWTANGLSNNAIWQTEDDTLLITDQSGNITPVINAKWMLDIIADKKYAGTKITAVDALSMDKNTKDSCNVTLNFKYEDVELSENAKTMDVVITASGNRNNPTYTITGNTAQLAAALHSVNPDEKKVVWSSSNNAVITVDANGNLAFVVPKDANGKYVMTNSEFIKAAMNNYNGGYTNTAKVVINAASEDGRMSDQCNVTVKLKYVNNTYSSSGGGGGGGGSSSGGGGGSSSSGVTPSGTKTSKTTLPSYVVSGTWVQDNTGKWLFTTTGASGRTYANEWAAVHNPYADTSKGQSSFDWFRFDEKGYMVTGWYTDTDGNIYYLNPVSDNTQGRMFTGWNWITGADGLQRCYFFKTVSDGTRGSLYRATTTPDGYTVDATGAWTVNGQVVTRQPQ